MSRTRLAATVGLAGLLVLIVLYPIWYVAFRWILVDEDSAIGDGWIGWGHGGVMYWYGQPDNIHTIDGYNATWSSFGSLDFDYVTAVRFSDAGIVEASDRYTYGGSSTGEPRIEKLEH